MPRSENQKFKILYLMRMLLERTDRNHIITMHEILEELERHGISAERKSIYHDVETLRQFGLKVEVRKGPPAGYCLVEREFGLEELELLADAVEVYPFIPAEDKTRLLGKLEKLAGPHDGEKLCRPVHCRPVPRRLVHFRSVHCSPQVPAAAACPEPGVDKIHEAMRTDSRISFRYFAWNVDKEPKWKRNGGQYQVSPWELVWVREQYFLAACEPGAKKIRYYRTDRMAEIELIGGPREGRAVYEASDVEAFVKQSFGMADGSETVVTLRLDNGLADAVIDRFGLDISLRPVDKETFQVKLPIVVSPQFYGWLAGLGRGVRLVSPREEAENYRKYLKRLLKEFK